MPNDREKIKQTVQERYGGIAAEGGTCCDTQHSCCGATSAEEIGKMIGYSEDELQSVPQGANLGLGCGNPVALATLKEGEVVIDLGAGAGLDCFIAAQRVGQGGRVIGVDMTPQMIHKARENAQEGGYKNVEFRLGEIEHLPAADASADVVISNCVINLSPDKPAVFEEAYRVLKPGGRMFISDMVLGKELPEAVRESVEAYVGCIAGALLEEDYLNTIRQAGFDDLKIIGKTAFPLEAFTADPIGKSIHQHLNLPRAELEEIAKSIFSIKVSAVKPVSKN
ncbi:MAG: arsenite methyltransferase [bacterium]